MGEEAGAKNYIINDYTKLKENELLKNGILNLDTFGK